MKTYKSLVKSLPPRSAVISFGEFDPPTITDQKQLYFAQNMAEHNNSVYLPYISNKTNNLLNERRSHYLSLMFPTIKFQPAGSLEEAIDTNIKKFKQLFVISDTFMSESKEIKPIRYTKIDSLINLETLKDWAKNGLFEQFKRGMPSTTRSIDARLIMNEIRESQGLPAIKEDIGGSVDNIRDRYFKKEIFNIGDLVEGVGGESFEIIKRCTNNVVCKDQQGNIVNKWLTELRP